jgi:hypothetical protein
MQPKTELANSRQTVVVVTCKHHKVILGGQRLLRSGDEIYLALALFSKLLTTL